jgi:CRP-like cAMP-binding protein
LPGDILGFDPDQFPIELESLVAVNNVKLISVASVTEAVACDARAHACLTQSIIASQNETQRRVLNSLVRIGAKTALERAADLFVELYERCKAIGFVQGLSFHMPLTQQMLANLIGISVVHANRTMAQLRMHRVFELVCGRATILDLVDLNRLADIAEDTSPGHRHWRSDKK